MENPDGADQGDRDLQARLDKLSAALKTQRAEGELQKQRGRGTDYSDAGRGMSLGFRVIADLLAGILVGTAIGWQLDRWFSTPPFLMILFLFLGTAAGILNVMRAASRPSKGGRDSGSS